MSLNPGQWVVIALSAILILGYVRGYFINRHKAEEITLWLREGLSAWGTVTPGARLGGMATGARMKVENATPPFARIEAIFVLEPRENLLFWLGTRLQGRRDQVALLIDFRGRPRYVAEVGSPRDRDFRRTAAALKDPIMASGSDAIPLQIALPQKHRQGAAAAIRRFLEESHQAIFRLTVQNSRPNLVVRAYLPTLQRESAQNFLAAVARLQEGRETEDGRE